MKTELILVGKTTSKHFAAGISDYTERIGHYMPFGIITLPDLKNTKSLTQELQKEREGEQILRLIQPTDTVVLLDEHGLDDVPMTGCFAYEKPKYITQICILIDDKERNCKSFENAGRNRGMSAVAVLHSDFSETKEKVEEFLSSFLKRKTIPDPEVEK